MAARRKPIKRLFSTALAVVLLLGLAALAVLARPASDAQVTQADSVAAKPPSPLSLLAMAPKVGGAKYNAIAVAIDNDKHLASALADDITATTGATALQVLKWHPDIGFSIYDPTDPFSEDFALAVGDPVFVLMQGTTATVYSLVGAVPAQNSVHFALLGSATACRYNFISVPLDKSALTLASELANDIGDAVQVLKWDPDTGFSIYDPTDPFSEDFQVRIGYPYFVCMAANKTWPTP